MLLIKMTKMNTNDHINCLFSFSTGLCCAAKNDFCTPTWGVQVCKSKTLKFSLLYCIKYYMWYTAFHIKYIWNKQGSKFTLQSGHFHSFIHLPDFELIRRKLLNFLVCRERIEKYGGRAAVSSLEDLLTVTLARSFLLCCLVALLQDLFVVLSCCLTYCCCCFFLCYFCIRRRCHNISWQESLLSLLSLMF